MASKNPLFSTITPPYDSLIDDSGPWAPDVIFDADSNIYKMWWEAEGGFLLATSPYIPSGTGSAIVLNNITIYPNPFSTQTTIRPGKLLKNATLTVNNCLGQTVKQIKNISGQTVTLHRDNLPSGLYFVWLTEENRTIAAGKLVITDK